MPWSFSADVATYAEQTWELLAAGRWAPGAMSFGWYTDAGGTVSGAVSLTPPYEMPLAAIPDTALDELVRELRAKLARVGRQWARRQWAPRGQRGHHDGRAVRPWVDGRHDDGDPDDDGRPDDDAPACCR